METIGHLSEVKVWATLHHVEEEVGLRFDVAVPDKGSAVKLPWMNHSAVRVSRVNASRVRGVGFKGTGSVTVGISCDWFVNLSLLPLRYLGGNCLHFSYREGRLKTLVPGLNLHLTEETNDWLIA